jgi:hypothetical protein
MRNDIATHAKVTSVFSLSEPGNKFRGVGYALTCACSTALTANLEVIQRSETRKNAVQNTVFKRKKRRRDKKWSWIRTVSRSKPPNNNRTLSRYLRDLGTG